MTYRSAAPHIVLLFLDGVGIGADDPEINPLSAGSLPILNHFCLNRNGRALPASIRDSFFSCVVLDATLGVEGLPQSGTGQTALFTGVNASRILGRHFGPYPHSMLRPLIAERNLLGQLRRAGKTVRFANAFPRKFFDYIEARKAHMTVTTLSSVESGVPLLREAELLAGSAVSADITNAGWHDLGYPAMPVIACEDAGRRLAHLSLDYDFMLFEYWKTDHAGHSQDMEEALQVLTALEKMLAGFLEAMDPERTLLVVTSDHGNVEDLRVKGHTRNPVPLVLYGSAHSHLARMVDGQSADLTVVTPAILALIGDS
jgi:predicted AlkP superfamily pyrophosphatase or phosphodiesterase